MRGISRLGHLFGYNNEINADRGEESMICIEMPLLIDNLVAFNAALIENLVVFNASMLHTED
jgi:hypothetical protein